MAEMTPVAAVFCPFFGSLAERETGLSFGLNKDVELVELVAFSAPSMLAVWKR